MTLPNFIIIGATKSGTTSVFRYLAQHPDVYLPFFKEPHYFAFEGLSMDFEGPYSKKLPFCTTLDCYEAMFENVTDQQAIGEGSAMYLYLHEQAAPRIKACIPNVRLIVLLRQPAERAYSNFMHMIRETRETCDSLDEALAVEEQRIKDNWFPFYHYRAQGFYSQQLQTYFDLFDRDQIRIYLHDDLKADTPAVMADLYDFLEIEPIETLDTSEKHNQSGRHKNALIRSVHSFLVKPNPIKAPFRMLIPKRSRRILADLIRKYGIEKEEMSPESYNHLCDIYHDDILRTEDMIQRDLSHWLVRK